MNYLSYCVWRFFGTGLRAWEVRLSERIAGAPVHETLLSMRAQLERILCENILPFWIDNVPRDERGVLLSEMREGSRRLNLVLLARYLWFASRLSESPYGRPEHLILASESYELMRGRLHDHECGGFFWEWDLDAERPAKPDKHLYAQAFAIHALARYSRASGDTDATDLAAESFALLDSHAHDREHGGYAECFSREWKPFPGRGYLGQAGDLKLVNTHMHLMEAFVELHRNCPGELLNARIVELVEILAIRAAFGACGVCLDAHYADWRPVRRRRNRWISYGHEVESIHLLRGACRSGLPQPDGIVERFRRRFAYCMAFGFDYDRGGFFARGRPWRAGSVTTKVWWVQAEAMLSALTMYDLTDEPQYLAVGTSLLDWLVAAQIDWLGGEWHRDIDPDGRPIGAKFDQWKGPYHNGRAVLECLRIVDALLAAPE